MMSTDMHAWNQVDQRWAQIEKNARRWEKAREDAEARYTDEVLERMFALDAETLLDALLKGKDTAELVDFYQRHAPNAWEAAVMQVAEEIVRGELS